MARVAELAAEVAAKRQLLINDQVTEEDMQMPQFTVQSCQPSKSGKSNVVRTTDGRTLYTKQGMVLKLGETYAADLQDSEYNGTNMTWINNPELIKTAAPGTPISHSANGPALSAAPPIWLPMASNVVAHAIQAGVIKEPDQVVTWVSSVKRAVETVISPIDDDIPF
jgi:chaperone required for assembly of F1-ATPase